MYEASSCPHSCLHLLLSILLVLAILVSVDWYLIAALTCIFLMTNDMFILKTQMSLF